MTRDNHSADASPTSLGTRWMSFPSAKDGPTLKGVLHIPERGGGPFPGAIVCHPHTMMGGNMGNEIIVSLCLGLADAGWAALRFNFRGAGDSEGHFDEGKGEMDDVKGAVDALFAQPEVDRRELVVIGYSFGAGVALRHAARDRRVGRLVGIALVKHHYNDSFLDEDRRPKLFIAGEDDQWAPAEELRQYVERLEPPKTLHLVPGAGHLFAGHVYTVTKATVDWLTG